MFKPRANNNNRSKRPNNSMNKRLNLELHGGKFIPSDDPPVTVSAPWNSAVIYAEVAFTAGTFSFFTTEDFIKYARTQLGFDIKPTDKIKEIIAVDLEYRFQSISLWAYPNSDKASEQFRISVYPMNLFNDSAATTELTRLESNSMRNKFAKVGYTYPLSHSTAVISSTGKKLKVVGYIANKKLLGIMHIKILWRGAIQGFSYSELFMRHVCAYPERSDSSVIDDDDDEVVHVEALSIDDKDSHLEKLILDHFQKGNPSKEEIKSISSRSIRS